MSTYRPDTANLHVPRLVSDAVDRWTDDHAPLCYVCNTPITDEGNAVEVLDEPVHRDCVRLLQASGRAARRRNRS